MKNIFIFQILLIISLLYACEKGGSSSISVGSEVQGGSLARFAVLDEYLYTVTLNQLNVFDVTKPEQPDFKYRIGVADNVETIFPLKNNLFIGTQGGVLIYDVSNPLSVKHLSSYSHIRSCDPVVANESTAYITLNSSSIRCSRGLNQLEVVDIMDKSAPKSLAVYPMFSPHGMALKGNQLFVCDGTVKRFEIQSDRSLKLLENINTNAIDAIISGDNLLLIGDDGLTQYDVSGNKARLLSEIKLGK